MSFDYSVDPTAPYQAYRVGPEGEPMILVDGIMNNAGSLVDYASSEGCYGPAGAAYPGVRCPAPPEYLSNLYNLHP